MARPGIGRLTLVDGSFEPVLRTGLLAFAAGALGGDATAFNKVLETLIIIVETARAEPLWRAAGDLLAGALKTPMRGEVVACARELLAGDTPAWRLQPLSVDPEIAALLLARLANPSPRIRVAILKALAPRVHDPAIRPALVACLHDPHEHARSTAIEVLRPVAATPDVRDALLAMFATDAPLPGAVDRALRRSLRVAAGDPHAQATLIAGLSGRKAWIAAHALEGATPDDALADALLAVLARDPGNLSQIWPAFLPVAHFKKITDAFVPLLAYRDPGTVQQALRIVGRGDGEAARAATIAALGHAENYVRWGAVQQLARQADRPDVREALRGRLGDADDGVRMYTVEALAEVDDASTREQLRGMLADPSEAVQAAAAGALARRAPDPAAWQVLAPHINSGFSAIYTRSWQACDPHAQIHTLIRLDEVRDTLATELRAYGARHRAAAAAILKDATPTAAIAERLAACIRDDVPHVASAAYATLAAWTGRSAPTTTTRERHEQREPA